MKSDRRTSPITLRTMAAICAMCAFGIAVVSIERLATEGLGVYGFGRGVCASIAVTGLFSSMAWSLWPRSEAADN
jgi:hypothetical protein